MLMSNAFEAPLMMARRSVSRIRHRRMQLWAFWDALPPQDVAAKRRAEPLFQRFGLC
jgi:hypothetical protein